MSITSTELESYSGDDYALALTFTDSNGVEINLTPFTLFVTIKTKYTDSDADAVYKVDLTSTSFTDAVHGKTTVIIPASATEHLEDVYVIDIKYKDGSGIVGTALNGRINFFKDISERASA